VSIKFPFFTFLIFFSTWVVAQSSYVSKGHQLYHFVDRMDVLHGNSGDIHTSLKSYARTDIKKLINNQDCTSLNHRDHILYHKNLSDLSYASDSTVALSKGFLKTFYKHPTHFFEVNTADFNLVLNPILNFQVGKENDSDEIIYLNKRGIEVYGDLDDKLYFYTNFHENQSNFLNYINPFIEKNKAIPGQGNYKIYQSSIFDDVNGYDYSNAQAYLGYKISKHTFLELGHNKHFIGNKLFLLEIQCACMEN